MGPVNTTSLHLQRTEEIATLRESMLSLWSEEGPWPLTLGSKRVFMSLVRQRFFIKDLALGELVPVNSWGVYQAVRWAAESLGLPRVAAQPQGGVLCMSCVSGQVASVEDSPLELGGPSKARSNLGDDPLEACSPDHVSDPVYSLHLSQLCLLHGLSASTLQLGATLSRPTGQQITKIWCARMQ